MQLKKHTEHDARKLSRRRFKNALVNIVAFGGRKDTAAGDYRPIRADTPVVFFVETDEHLAAGINPIWEHVVFSGYGRDA